MKIRFRYNGLLIYCVVLTIAFIIQTININNILHVGIDKKIKAIIFNYPTREEVKQRSTYFELWKCDLSIRMMDVEALANAAYIRTTIPRIIYEKQNNDTTKTRASIN